MSPGRDSKAPAARAAETDFGLVAPSPLAPQALIYFDNKAYAENFGDSLLSVADLTAARVAKGVADSSSRSPSASG